MDRPKLEVADVFRRYGETYRQEHGASLSMAQRRVMTAIEVCRTAVLGGHLEQCDIAGISATLSTPVRIVTAQNANRLLGLNGLKTVRPSSKHSILSRCVHSTSADCNHCLSE
jgi:hypothetical protein